MAARSGSGMKNLALHRPATQSSRSMFSRGETNEDDARGGNNGELTGDCGFHTNFGHPSWWMVDLGSDCQIEKIVIFNRLDHRERLRHFTLLGSIDGLTWTELFRKYDDLEFGGIDGTPWVVNFSPRTDQRYIKLRQDDDGMFLHFDELQVFGQRKGHTIVPAAPILSGIGGHGAVWNNRHLRAHRDFPRRRAIVTNPNASTC